MSDRKPGQAPSSGEIDPLSDARRSELRVASAHRSRALDRLLKWVYGHPGWFPALSDMGMWVVASALLSAASLLLAEGSSEAARALLLGAIGATVQGVFGWVLGPYQHRWRISSFDEMMATTQAWLLGLVVVVASGRWLVPSADVTAEPSVAISITLLAFVLICFTRVVWRQFWEDNQMPDPHNAKRTVVLGGSERAEQIIRLMMQDPDGKYLPVAVLDDESSSRQRVVHGVRVQGASSDLRQVVERTRATALVVVLDSHHSGAMLALSEEASELGLEILVLPSTSAFIGGTQLTDIRPPSIEELLGRDAVEIDLGSVSELLRGKIVLVTGAGGSIGSEISRLIAEFEPQELYLLDRDESALHALQLSMEGRALLDSRRLIVADIRDRDRVFEVFEDLRPDVVFHTAALKHLTLLENHPSEAVKTNVEGTRNLLDAAAKFEAGHFVNISTDKAADPTSVLGASKLIAERLTAQAAEATNRRFVSVRFGNVLGSRGSVIPTFVGQIELDEPITITHPDVTRYFMTIGEAARLVLQSAAIGRPGEVMILDMGEPVRILDLAQQLVDALKPEHPIVFTGLRPGEKLHEVLIGVDEAVTTREHSRIFHTQSSCDVDETSNMSPVLQSLMDLRDTDRHRDSLHRKS